MPQSLMPGLVADTLTHTEELGWPGHRVRNTDGLKREAPGKQGSVKEMNLLDWDGPIWSGMQSVGLPSPPTQDFLARGRKVGREA